MPTNPDLPWRLEIGGPLNMPILAAFDSSGPVGYTAYPALQLLETTA